ncbi:MAG: hypothetical protein ACRETX_12220, partial [Steroidobacteraceae bacterium]
MLNDVTLDDVALDDVALGGSRLDGIAIDGISLDGIALDDIALDGVALDDIPVAGTALEGLRDDMALELTQIELGAPQNDARGPAGSGEAGEDLSFNMPAFETAAPVNA